MSTEFPKVMLVISGGARLVQSGGRQPENRLRRSLPRDAIQGALGYPVTKSTLTGRWCSSVLIPPTISRPSRG
jgi:hypothetical protein